MNNKFVYQVGNNKKSYTMMRGQPIIKMHHDVYRYALSSGLWLLPRYSVQIYSTTSSRILSASVLSSVGDTKYYTL
jgi:hypothetical protein